MKVFVVVERPSDVAILKAILSSDSLALCDFVSADGGAALSSIARTLLVKHRRPLAVMFDTNTLEASVIREAYTTMDQLLSAVAGATPVIAIPCIPELEAVFFEAPAALNRLFPQYNQQFFLMFAKASPRKALDYLFKNGGVPRSLPDFLTSLSPEDIEQLKSTHPVNELISFVNDASQTRPPSGRRVVAS